MKLLRCILALAAALVLPVAALAQPAANEAGVRAALQRCVDAWNHHEPPAFGDCLTEDVWFSEADDSFYQRYRGRAKVLGTFDYNIRSTDLEWEVVRIKALPDGGAAVQLRQRIGILPRTPTGYTKMFDSDPAFARLRQDGGTWKLYFFTSHAGWARSLLQALDQPAPAAATPPASAPRVADKPVPPGMEPPAYTMQFGIHSASCFHCHGRRPTLSEDGDRGRIVSAGGGASDAATLRLAMTTPRAGGIMDYILADPALSDERLDSIRLWLRTLRDGHAERVDDRVVIRNLRSERDPPARLDLLRAEGGWQLPQDASCRAGSALAGGAQCDIRLPQGSVGALVFRFAGSQGLEPQEVRLPLAAR